MNPATGKANGFEDSLITWDANIHIAEKKDWPQTMDLLQLSQHNFFQTEEATFDGRNPAPVDMVNIPLLTGFHTSLVVQDFFSINSMDLKWI